jgi:hypothetical protein
MQITTELDTIYYEKLQQLQQAMGKNLRTLLEIAIDDLYARHKVLIIADSLTSPVSRNTWAEFFLERDRLLIEEPDELKGFMSECLQTKEQYLQNPFEEWKE